LPPSPPSENHVIEIKPSTQKARYKRTELSDEHRCTAITSRGTRCTLERESGQSLCSRHVAKHKHA
jgi:hypothetical protein